ncbi:hypothetical protein AMAG_05147 [Allomyces macrogynus ATCC 38327]|uniref:Uncharacterized protein n=1 Tax=Allomyces macrogynus (strain ATCC 38327) TaxID=578462 RepID=A0A0L0SB71_ALLM3|nr:hypothetical protein AMAG_05147 [Allomyces macrogynus ATCC 38327]|eukprot:KNE59682.1 hypothetical protein AMAG_05147 [Allomyces macrogynus ATCC 38327]
MGGYRVQQSWEPVGARVLGTIAMLIAVGLFSWLMYNVFAPNNRNASALALGGGGGIPRPNSRKSKCNIASWCAGFAHGLWTGHNARLPLLIFLSVLLVIDTMSCFVHLWLDAYPFVNMLPVYIVRMCTSNWNGGMLTLIVVRRSMVVAASSAKARLGVWLWRVMLLIYLILQPIFTYSTAMAVLDADARNNWLRFGVNPLVVLLSLVYPVVCIVCSLGMGLFAYRLARAMGDFGPGSSTSASGTADKSNNEVGTFRPDMSVPAHTGAAVAPATAPAAALSKISDNRSRVASSTVAPPSASGPRASATGTSFVHRTVITFQILNAAIVLLWVLYLIVQLLGVGSPFTRIILSNTFNGLFLVMEAALKWIMRAGHAIAVRKQQRSAGSSKTTSKSAGSQPQSVLGGTHAGLVSTTIGLK